MFDDYTTDQLVNLRILCVDLEKTQEVRQRADAHLLLQYIEEELALRALKRSA